jgi:carbon monoxide dehydrogenase subunit G
LRLPRAFTILTDWCEKAAEKGDVMEFGGRYFLSAPRERVWAALNDTDVLAAAIPGCRRIEWTGPATLALEIGVSLGPLNPVFSGDLTLSDVRPAESYRLAGRGRGGLLGLAHGAADIALADGAGGTELRFLAQGGASGRLMQLGRALLGHSAQAVIDGFFARFAAAMGAEMTVLEPG